jgi:lactate dehydrogenase-like 2-hydroxyacid dehydrogenase
VLCTLTDSVGPEVLSAHPLRARLLANFGVGVNHIDLAAARARGLVVTNTPGVLTECTADLTIGLMLMVLRRLGEGERELRAGRWTGWRPTHLLGRRVSGRTLGIIGFGRIGQAVARRANRGFGMRVLAFNPTPPSAEALAESGAERRDSVEEVLREAEIVSLHCPLTAETRHLIDAGRLAMMRPDAVLINTARGEIVDHAALAAAMIEGRIAGAGLDVYEGEPAVPAALLALENVVLLPHQGSATVESRTAMGMRAVINLRSFFAGQAPPDRVA